MDFAQERDPDQCGSVRLARFPSIPSPQSDCEAAARGHHFPTPLFATFLPDILTGRSAPNMKVGCVTAAISEARCVSEV